MKYAIGYSGGKDCTFTIEKLKEQGHELVGIIVLKSKDNLSFNHALTMDICEQYADALGVPLYLVNCNEVFDADAIYDTMVEMKKNGVEAIAYGETRFYYHDMSHLAYHAGLQLLAPLYKTDNESLMNELLSKNYKMFIINASKKISCAKEIIGKYIDRDIVDKLKKEGMDFTGNDGSYHSQVVDCPLFKHPIQLGKSRIVDLENVYLVVFDGD